MDAPDTQAPEVVPFPVATQCVIFGVPCYSHTVSLGFWLSTLQLEGLLCQHGIAHGLIPLKGDPYLAKARNHIVTLFLDDFTPGTDLFFLDDDVSFPAEAVLRLLNHPADIVAGVYPHKNEIGTWPAEIASRDGRLIQKDGAYLANLAPTGFMRIKRHVLERMAKDADTYPDRDATGRERRFYNIFECGYARGPGEWWGEDFAFIAKARGLGFDPYIVADIDFGHQGMREWTGNYGHAIAAWLEKQKEAAA